MTSVAEPEDPPVRVAPNETSMKVATADSEETADASPEVDGGSISGRVIDAGSGEALPDFEIRARKGDSCIAASATDHNGAFQFSGLVAGTYVLSLPDGAYLLDGPQPRVTVALGEDTSGVVVRVRLGGVVTGRVFDAKTKAPIPDIKVWSLRLDGPYGYERTTYIVPFWGPPTRFETDAAGSFRIEGLETGRYRVGVRSDEALVTEGPGRGRYEKGSGSGRRYIFHMDEGQVVAVAAGQVVEGIEFPVWPGKPISGVVLDERGIPEPAAMVDLPGREFRVQADGSFLHYAHHNVETVEINAYTWEGAVSNTVGPVDLPAQGLGNIVLRLRRGASISGRVIDAAMRPMPGAVVEGPGPRSPVRTDAAGEFHFKGLEGGRHEVAVVKPPKGYERAAPVSTIVDVREGQDVTGIVLETGWQNTKIDGREVATNLTISGCVTDEAGQPVAGATVSAKPEGSASGSWNVKRTKTDASGTYAIEDLLEGAYRVAVRHNVLTSFERADVAAGQNGVDFVLQARGAIEGQVVCAATNDPIESFAIERDGETPEKPLWFYDKAGRFRLEGVEAGHSSVTARAPGYVDYSGPVGDVRPGETLSDVIIQMQPAAAIEGIVVTERGAPIENVHVYPTRGPQLSLYFGDSLAGVTAADGIFTLEGLTDDTIHLLVRHEDYAPLTTSITPTPGRTTPVRLVLTHGGRVEGRLTLDGEPVRGNVSVDRVNTDEGDIHVRTHPDGYYCITDIAPGEARVGAGSFTGGSYRSIEYAAEVAEGAITTVDFAFETGIGSAAVEGQVTVNGQPKAGASVDLDASTVDGGRLVLYTKSDEDGMYRFDALPAGRAEIRAWSDGRSRERLTIETMSGEVTPCGIELSAD